MTRLGPARAHGRRRRCLGGTDTTDTAAAVTRRNSSYKESGPALPPVARLSLLTRESQEPRGRAAGQAGGEGGAARGVCCPGDYNTAVVRRGCSGPGGPGFGGVTSLPDVGVPGPRQPRRPRL